MAKESKAKDPAQPEKAPVTDAPTGRPSGHVRRRGHGLQGGPIGKPLGVQHLREVMNLSVNVGLENLCEEAAVELQTLRTKVAERQ